MQHPGLFLDVAHMLELGATCRQLRWKEQACGGPYPDLVNWIQRVA